MAASTEISDSQSDVILTLPNDIIVRHYRPSDAASLSKHGTSPAIFANLTDRMPQPYTEADATWWINHNSNPANQVASGPYEDTTRTSSGPLTSTNFCILIANEPCGSIGLEFGELDTVSRRQANLGYWLGEQYWGRGVMSVVAKAFVEWSFARWERLVRIGSSVYVGNPASAKVLLKAGLEYEGRMRAKTVKAGKVRSEDLYGIVRDGVLYDEGVEG